MYPESNNTKQNKKERRPKGTCQIQHCRNLSADSHPWKSSEKKCGHFGAIRYQIEFSLNSGGPAFWGLSQELCLTEYYFYKISRFLSYKRFVKFRTREKFKNF